MLPRVCPPQIRAFPGRAARRKCAGRGKEMKTRSGRGRKSRLVLSIVPRLWNTDEINSRRDRPASIAPPETTAKSTPRLLPHLSFVRVSLLSEFFILYTIPISLIIFCTPVSDELVWVRKFAVSPCILLHCAAMVLSFSHAIIVYNHRLRWMPFTASFR